MVADVCFYIELSSGFFWDFALNDGWLIVRTVYGYADSYAKCNVLISQSFSNSCDWVRAIVHLAIRTGAKKMRMETSSGDLWIDGRRFKYTYRESRGYFYE